MEQGLAVVLILGGCVDCVPRSSPPVLPPTPTAEQTSVTLRRASHRLRPSQRDANKCDPWPQVFERTVTWENMVATLAMIPLSKRRHQTPIRRVQCSSTVHRGLLLPRHDVGRGAGAFRDANDGHGEDGRHPVATAAATAAAADTAPAINSTTTVAVQCFRTTAVCSCLYGSRGHRGAAARENAGTVQNPSPEGCLMAKQEINCAGVFRATPTASACR